MGWIFCSLFTLFFTLLIWWAACSLNEEIPEGRRLRLKKLYRAAAVLGVIPIHFIYYFSHNTLLMNKIFHISQKLI